MQNNGNNLVLLCKWMVLRNDSLNIHLGVGYYNGVRLQIVLFFNSISSIKKLLIIEKASKDWRFDIGRRRSRNCSCRSQSCIFLIYYYYYLKIHLQIISQSATFNNSEITAILGHNGIVTAILDLYIYI